MRMCRLTCCLAVVLVGFVNIAPLRAAVEPLASEWFVVTDIDDYPAFAEQGLSPRNCASEGACACVSDWISVSPSANRYLGNAYEITQTRKLAEFEIGLSFVDPTDLCFSIHRQSVDEPETEYEQVWVGSSMEALGTGGPTFYSSGPFDGDTNPEITLDAGYIYALAVYWDATRAVTAGYKSGYAEDFGAYAFKRYVLKNSPQFPGGCPAETMTPDGSPALAFSARVCLAPEPGACCRVDPVTTDRGCVEVFEGECVEDGSYFYGDGTTCAVTLCEFGACCSACGECEPNYTPQGCAAKGGTHTVGANCNDYATLCPVTSGACCTGGTCRVECEEWCRAGDDTHPPGDYKDDGTTCDQNPCVGACCKDECCIESNVIEADACTDYTDEFCTDFVGWDYLGDGTSCSGQSLANECGGACCFDGGGCQDDPEVITSRARCTEYPGGVPGAVYLGDGTSCPDPATCAAISETATGCCLPDGTCINTTVEFCGKDWVQGHDLSPSLCPVVPSEVCAVGRCCSSDGACQLITEYACIDGGVGETWAIGGACDSDTCPQPTGACCAANATCSIETEALCTDMGGFYQGDGTLCPPDPEAVTCTELLPCCLDRGECVEQVAAPFCTGTLMGTVGLGDTCDDAECPDNRGPCCTATGECLSILEAECVALVPAGDFPNEGLTCGQTTCASTGACCLVDRCVDFTADGCDDVGGIYQGDDTRCADVGRCDLGACCQEVGGCEDDIHPDDCIGADLFAGAETTCGGDICNVGICCLTDGSCGGGLIASGCAALGGIFNWNPGVELTCEGNAEELCSPAGACCTNVSCFDVVETVCDEMESIYQGDGTSCTEDGRCDLGACCDLPGDTCDVTHTEADCVDAGGLFAGVDTTCDGNTCNVGICCLTDGSCEDRQLASGCALGGIFNWNPDAELTCDINGAELCPPGGACCLLDGSCEPITAAACSDKEDNVCSVSGDPCTTNDDCAEGYCMTAIWVPDAAACDSDPGLCRRGPCCSHETGTCEDKLIASVCAGPFEEFHESLNCLSISCNMVGACCRGDGTCRDDVPEWDCPAPYDVFHPVTACADLEDLGTPCERIGACCRHLEGVCDDLVVESDCTDAGELFFAERDCESASVGDCDQWGGCCEDWACTVKSEADCALSSGVYLGPGKPCVPDICGERVGTCCSLDTGTFEDKVLDNDCPEGLLLVDDCASDRTAHEFGRGVDGDPSMCVAHGPCCLWPDVKYETQQRCETLGGHYAGDGAVCDVELCTPGSCCVRGFEPGVDAICQERPVQACEFEGGGFLGEGDRCEYFCSRSGRGCDIDHGSYDCDKTCTVGGNVCTSDDECLLFGCSDGTECTPDQGDCQNSGVCSDGTPCPVDIGYCFDAGYCDDDSACSVSGQDCQDGSDCVRECRHVPCSRERCEPTEKCVVAACARGWCCRPDGTCDPNVVEVQCSGPLYAGQFHVYEEDPVDVEYCPEPEDLALPANHCWPRGACCKPNGECVETRGDDNSCADDFDGTYAGDGTTCELTDRCVLSACCVPGGVCDMRTRQDCEPTGVYVSGHPDCDGVVCTRGSCCLMEGTCTGNTVASACSLGMGDFRDGDSCTEECLPRGACCQPEGGCGDNVIPRNCADVLNTFHFASRCVDVGDTCTTSGACCLADGECTVMDYVACNDEGGSYFSHGLPCDPMPCCPDADPSGVVWTDPPADVIDARQPRKVDDGTVLQGIDTIEVNGPGDANPACWTLCETEVEGSQNNIASVVEDPPGTYTIELQRRITPGAVTKITYTSWSGATAETGSFRFLPGDTGADGRSNAVDVTKLVECCLNQSCSPPFDKYSCDIDHSGAATGADALRLIDLLNGAGDLDPWDGQSAPDDGECP